MNNDFSAEEINRLGNQEDGDFTPDISEKQALVMVNQARHMAAWKKKRAKVIEELQKYEGKPEKRWQLVYDWLMKSNPQARYAVNLVIKECEELRQTRSNRFAQAENMALRFGMRIPQVVLDTITLVDPRIRQMELLSAEDAKKVYRQLERAFPQFRIPRD